MARSETVTQTPGTPSALVGGSAILPDTPNSIASIPDHTVGFRTGQNPHKDRQSDPTPASTTDPTSLPSSLAVLPKRLGAHYRSNFLTGAAAMAENKRQREEEERTRSRRTTPNPARAAVGALLGGPPPGMSQIHEEPGTTNPVSGPVAEVAASLNAPEISHGESTLQTSPVSMSSLATLESTSMGVSNANGVSVASPGRIEEQTAQENMPGDNASQPEEARSNKAMTFPGPLLGAHPDARRGMSLPHSGLASPRSPSTKKHRCPYCATDFTRHHNLKSHLLTHSHEKPYMCETCNQRFRRLHDLKRHAKLHTGERPHVCPKCDRSFARGDALARHNKGQGGCAGRRSSMGSYGGDDRNEDRLKGPGHDESMSGLMYTGVASHEPDRMDEDSEGADTPGASLPTIRPYEARDPHQHPTESDPPGAYQSRSPSSYPPMATRQPTGGLYPPVASHGNPSPATTPGGPNPLGQYPGTTGSGSSVFPGAGPHVFPQGIMTESPKPLSPGSHADPSIQRNRSPSLTQALTKNRFGRRATTHNTPPSIGLPPPVPGSTHPKPPQLPSLSGLPLPESRFTLHSQTPGATHMHSGTPSNLPGSSGTMGSPRFHSQVGHASANNSLSSHGTGSVTAGDHNVYVQSNERLWAYVRSLEVKIDRLQDEVASLKSQLSPSSHR
jgi:DNA-directed RNA polymerase subunit RPC12/RpoP